MKEQVEKSLNLASDSLSNSFRHLALTLQRQYPVEDRLSAKISKPATWPQLSRLHLDTYVDCQPDMQNEAAESLQRRFYG